MAVGSAHPTVLHEGCDFETAEEVIDFALRMNMSVRLGGGFTGGRSPGEPGVRHSDGNRCGGHPEGKVDLDFRPYQIVRGCNPPLACKALQAEDKIGTMLTCNVIVQPTDDGEVEIAASDPAASMAAVDKPVLEVIVATIGAKLCAGVEQV